METLLSSGFGVVAYFAFLIGLMWFIVVRPQRKRERAMQEMQQSIKVGDMVVTNSGMYGKVVDIVNDIFVLEIGLNKSVRVPVQKQAVTGVQEPNLTIAKETEDSSEDPTDKKED